MNSRTISLVLAIVLAACACSYPAQPQPLSSPSARPPAPPGSRFDDFLGPSGAPPDSTLWDYDIGPYQDDGLQTYTTSPDNVRLDGEGHMVIQARKTRTGYTSARVVTRGKLSMRYGRMTARIKFPTGLGIWPAFWMLGSNAYQVGWPRCGEIDLMELVNKGTEYHVTLHGPEGDSDYFGGTKVSGQVVGTSGPIADLTTNFSTTG